MDLCLSNSIILRKTLEHFSDTELLELSLVNKLWNCEARSLMKKRSNLVAHITWTKQKSTNDGDPYAVLKAFGKDLRQMNVVPFSGISIDVPQFDGDLGARNTVLDPTLEAILYKLTLNHISINTGIYGGREDFPAFLLIKRVIHHYSDVLEVLSLHIHPEEACSLEKVLHQSAFPRLKVLKLPYFHLSWSWHKFYDSFEKLLISRAPNLQELHYNGKSPPIGKLLEGRRSTVLVLTSRVSAPFHQIPNNFTGAVRLEGDMDLFYTGPEFNFQRFNTITPTLLQASCTTICHVRMDVVLALSLMSYAVSLKNVERLDLWIDYCHLERIEPRILRIVKDFDFNQIFPSLDEVTVVCNRRLDELSSLHMNAIIEEANAVLKEPHPARAFNIKKLHLVNVFSKNTAQFYGEMYPNIKYLRVEATEDVQVPFGCIWKYWVELEELEVRCESIHGNLRDLDGHFCGISTDEKFLLRRMDEEYLKAVNIVPVMPAITCLRNLSTFTLEYDQLYGDYPRLMSTMTGLTAFARMPNLTVKILTSCANVYAAMKDMKPYASVVFEPE